MGFYDALVAAPSQKAALKAWGTTTDLFAAGRASVVEDPELQKLALARPGEVVKRSRGDEEAILGQIEREGRGKARQDRATPERSRRPSKAAPAPDRTELDQAERDLNAARRDIDARLVELGRRRDELEAEERALRSEGDARIFELERIRDIARRAYERAAVKAG
jgi:hypothetical protein